MRITKIFNKKPAIVKGIDGIEILLPPILIIKLPTLATSPPLKNNPTAPNKIKQIW